MKASGKESQKHLRPRVFAIRRPAGAHEIFHFRVEHLQGRFQPKFFDFSDRASARIVTEVNQLQLGFGIDAADSEARKEKI